MSLGLGAMIHILGGGSKNSADKYYGKTIKEASLDGNELRINFEGGPTIKIWDAGQSCCESRYITSDDKAVDLIGKKLTSITTKDVHVESVEDMDDIHEACFVEINAEGEIFTMVTHNEHNGYYGGFGLTIDEI